MELIPELYIRIAIPNCPTRWIDSPRLQLLVKSMARMLPRMARLKNVILDIKTTRDSLLRCLMYEFPRSSKAWRILESSRNAHDMDRLFDPLKPLCTAAHIWVPVRSARINSPWYWLDGKNYNNAVDQSFDIDADSPALKRWALDTWGACPWRKAQR